MYESLTSNIIKAIADSEDVKPANLDFILADYIDPDAVENLAKQSSSTWRLEFELPKHVVTVKSNSEILVDGQQKRDCVSD